MPYTVAYLPSVETQLGDLLLTATDRNAVAAAANQIDFLLKYGPDSVGDDLRDWRELTVAPLTISYVFSPGDCLVTVIGIRLTDD